MPEAPRIDLLFPDTTDKAVELSNQEWIYGLGRSLSRAVSHDSSLSLSERSAAEVEKATSFHLAGHSVIAWKRRYQTRLGSLAIDEKGTGSLDFQPHFQLGCEHRREALVSLAPAQPPGRVRNLTSTVLHRLKRTANWFSRQTAIMEAKIWLAGPLAEHCYLSTSGPPLEFEEDHLSITPEWFEDVHHAAWT